jgi:hypothetical protein
VAGAVSEFAQVGEGTKQKQPGLHIGHQLINNEHTKHVRWSKYVKYLGKSE